MDGCNLPENSEGCVWCWCRLHGEGQNKIILTKDCIKLIKTLNNYHE